MMVDLNRLTAELHSAAVEKGFWGVEDAEDKHLAKMVSELGEVVQADRAGIMYEVERDGTKPEGVAAELEQVKQERDGLNIMLTSAQSAAETHNRKLDAALADMKAIAEKTGCCHCCAHQADLNPDGSCDRFDPQNPSECWEWRGTHEKDRTLRADRADRTGTV